MKRISKTLAVAVCFLSGAIESSGQVAPMLDTPRTRMQPIGVPSAVDRYRNANETSNQLRQVSSTSAPVQRVVETSTNIPLNSRQVSNLGQVRQAQFEMPSSPQGPVTSGPNISAPGITSAPPITTMPNAPLPNTPLPNTPLPNTPLPNTPLPNTLAPTVNAPNSSSPIPAGAVPVGPARPVGPRVITENPVPPSPMPLPRNLPSANDLTPMAPPQLNDGFATLNNSCHVSGPSGYSAGMASGCCAPVGYNAPLPPVAPPASSVPFGFGATTVPPPSPLGVTPAPSGNLFPTAPDTNGPGPAGALLSFGQERYPVQVGPGIFGQPTAYVEGQPIRNWLRYLSP